MADVYKFDPTVYRDRVRERPRLVLNTGSESMTQQQYKDECDINFLMKRYEKTGLLPHITKPQFHGDFSTVPDYQDAMNTVLKAQEMFSSLSAKVRKEFDNDPAKFLEFCNDPANGQRLVEMGLREPPKAAPEPVAVKVVQDVPAAPEAPK